MDQRRRVCCSLPALRAAACTPLGKASQGHAPRLQSRSAEKTLRTRSAPRALSSRSRRHARARRACPHAARRLPQPRQRLPRGGQGPAHVGQLAGPQGVCERGVWVCMRLLYVRGGAEGSGRCSGMQVAHSWAAAPHFLAGEGLEGPPATAALLPHLPHLWDRFCMVLSPAAFQHLPPHQPHTNPTPTHCHAYYSPTHRPTHMHLAHTNPPTHPPRRTTRC